MSSAALPKKVQAEESTSPKLSIKQFLEVTIQAVINAFELNIKGKD